MAHVLIDFSADVEFGEPQSHRNIDIIPLFLKSRAETDYIMLKEAIDLGLITITELSEGGSVPELKVLNRGEKPVLILDGEELAGSKQNRVLNSSVLIKEMSETVIPVSCTEQGRWSYSSKEFRDSDVIMSKELRMKKNFSVRKNLERGAGHRSDQGEVWHSIHSQCESAGVSSSTSAMKDIHESYRSELDDVEGNFTLLPGQQGILAFINGRIVGLDAVSSEACYKKVHAKLLRSYVLDAVLGQNAKTVISFTDLAKSFVKEIAGCDVKEFPSVSLGTDIRFENGRIFGSALQYRQTLIHTAVFARANGSRSMDGGMEGLSRRAGFRGPVGPIE